MGGGGGGREREKGEMRLYHVEIMRKSSFDSIFKDDFTTTTAKLMH